MAGRDEMEQSFFQRIKRKFKLWLARRLPDCRNVTPTISDSLDRELSLREQLVMKLHLFTCEKCARYLRQIRFLRDAMHDGEDHFTELSKLDSAKLGGDVKDGLKARLSAASIAR